MKITILTLVLMFTANIAFAQYSSPPTTSNGCVSGNCVNGKGKMIYTGGDIYEGDFVNGKNEGQGTFTFKSGEVYIGQFANDNLNGKGKMTFPDGESYEGDFVDNKREGKGTYTVKNGNYYTGEWKNNKRHGKGKFFNKSTNITQEGKWEFGNFVDSKTTEIVQFTDDDVQFLQKNKSQINETVTRLRETMEGKFNSWSGNPLMYYFKNKKTGEALEYKIEFIEDGGKLAFKWKETTKNEESEKLVIDNTALYAGFSYINFFTKKTGPLPKTATMFILSRVQFDSMKSANKISLKLGTTIEDLRFKKEVYLTFGEDNFGTNLLEFQSSDEKTKMRVVDNPICPLIVMVETPEYILNLAAE